MNRINFVIGVPPESGATHLTVIDVFDAVTFVSGAGCAGTVADRIATSEVYDPSPTPFSAETLNLKVSPGGDNPVRVYSRMSSSVLAISEKVASLPPLFP